MKINENKGNQFDYQKALENTKVVPIKVEDEMKKSFITMQR